MSDRSPVKTVRNAIDLWAVLKERGGIQKTNYDSELVTCIAKELGIQSLSDQHLTNVTTTQFMRALLTAIEPWSAMMSDILDAFARDGVTGSQGGVLVEFEFGEGLQGLRFDIDQFRTARQAIADLRHAILGPSTSPGELFKIIQGLDDALEAASPSAPKWPNIHSTAPNQWLGPFPRGSQNDHFFWPYQADAPLPQWAKGDPLGAALIPVLQLLMGSNLRLGNYISWPDMLSKLTMFYSTGEDMHPSARKPLTDWNEGAFLQANSDRQARSLFVVIWRLHDFAPISAGARGSLASDIGMQIASFVDFPRTYALQNLLEDLLDLPLWKKRHELYSVWLTTVVKRSVPKGAAFRLCPGADGVLRFAFKETVIATISSASEDLELVSELRTPKGVGMSLAGKGRVQAVQPDYVIRDRSNPGHVSYVLEAKQYKTGSVGNFSRALYDYATVHRQATVCLVNYGSLPKTWKQRVKGFAAHLSDTAASALTERCRAWGELRPGTLNLDHVVADIGAIFKTPIIDTVVIDATDSMIEQLPRSGELPAAWQRLTLWTGRIIVVTSGTATALPGDAGKSLIGTLRSHAKSGTLNFSRVQNDIPESSVLITDRDGFAETADWHHRFIAVFTLNNGGKEVDCWLRDDAPDHMKVFLKSHVASI